MDADRWIQIKAVFHSALEQPDDGRAAFIHSQCCGDESLAQEVESLLAAHDQAESFIESPALASIATDFAIDPTEAVGQRIGLYRVIRRIGAGGILGGERTERSGRQVWQKPDRKGRRNLCLPH